MSIRLGTIKEVFRYIVSLESLSSTLSEPLKAFISSGRYSACEIKELIPEITKEKE